MRRSVIEWAIVYTVFATVAIAFTWVDSLTLQLLKEPLALGTHLFARYSDDRICFFSDLGDDWKPQEFGKARRTMTWSRSYTTWFFPGIEFHHRRMASGHAIWSIEIAPIWPFLCALLVLLLLWRLRSSHPKLPAPNLSEDPIFAPEP